MITPLTPLIPPDASLVQAAPPQGGSGSLFEQALAAAFGPLQQLPVVGTIFRAVVNHPLQIAGAAAQGFLAGGPVGAVAGAGLTALSDQVSGDGTIVQRTEALLKAYGPLATT
ncbi:MAG: hypothetical protein M0002_08770 [Rhodospirillales bacterium]|nr:hypothetical protein [Rhodospirillales bacterium]